MRDQATVNGRPLTKMSDDLDDVSALTLNHLLAPMRSAATTPPVDGAKHDECAGDTSSTWPTLLVSMDSEYLPEIQHRQKWLHDTDSPVRRNEPCYLSMIFDVVTYGDLPV